MPRPVSELAQSNRPQATQGRRNTSPHPKVVGPLRRGETHKEQGADENHHQPQRRAPARPRHLTVPQHRREHKHNAHERNQHRKPAGERPIHLLLEQHLIAHPLLEPLQRRALIRTHIGGLPHIRQRLIPEHGNKHRRAGRHKRRQHSRPPADPLPPGGILRHPEIAQPPVHDPNQTRQRHQQRRHRHQAGRATRQGERRNNRANSSRRQPLLFDGTFERHPGGQRAQRNDRLRAQTIIIRKPKRQKHQRRCPMRRPTGSNPRTQAWQHLPGHNQPDQQAGHQRRQPHPRGRGRHPGH